MFAVKGNKVKAPPPPPTRVICSLSILYFVANSSITSIHVFAASSSIALAQSSTDIFNSSAKAPTAIKLDSLFPNEKSPSFTIPSTIAASVTVTATLTPLAHSIAI